jgi:hypothetical protein
LAFRKSHSWIDSPYCLADGRMPEPVIL